MQHSFATDVEEILASLTERPLVVLRPSLEGAHAILTQIALPQAIRLALVSDAHTHAALGERVQRELEPHYIVHHTLLPGTPQPDAATVRYVGQEASLCDALVAVGSGTINDVCKAAAYAANKPYIVFPTAPSMNGYTSANASIIEGGHKNSRPCAMPAAVLCDLGVIAAAPVRLIRAGLGDSLARSTAQADWLLSHLLQQTHYDARPFTMLAPYEPRLLQNAAALGRGDKDAVATLMEVLLLSGFGMTLSNGSYPASEGEHMIAHTYETNYGAGGTYHGEQIGVTTLTMARLQEKVVGTLPAEVQQKIRPVMLPSAAIEAALKAAGCPTTPHELGWDDEKYAEAVKQARHSRDRFTFLELA